MEVLLTDNDGKILHKFQCAAVQLDGRYAKALNCYDYTNYDKVYSPSTHTSAINMIAFAILMGCNPIYVGGLDLDCALGYGKNANPKATFNQGHMGHWKKIYRKFLIDDMRILNESAKLMDTTIINLNKNSWHNEFTKDNFKF